jgi:hypothetical protein
MTKRKDNGRFKPGASGNPKGRPKGSKNKDVKALRERVKDLLDANFDRIVADLEELEPKERVSAYFKLLEFALPKLKAIEAKIDGDIMAVQPPTIIIGDNLPDWMNEGDD